MAMRAAAQPPRSVFDSPGPVSGYVGGVGDLNGGGGVTRAAGPAAAGPAGGDAGAMLQHFKLSMELNELLSRSEHEAAFSSALQVYTYIFRERERERER